LALEEMWELGPGVALVREGLLARLQPVPEELEPELVPPQAPGPVLGPLVELLVWVPMLRWLWLLWGRQLRLQLPVQQMLPKCL